MVHTLIPCMIGLEREGTGERMRVKMEKEGSEWRTENKTEREWETESYWGEKSREVKRLRGKNEELLLIWQTLLHYVSPTVPKRHRWAWNEILSSFITNSTVYFSHWPSNSLQMALSKLLLIFFFSFSNWLCVPSSAEGWLLTFVWLCVNKWPLYFFVMIVWILSSLLSRDLQWPLLSIIWHWLLNMLVITSWQRKVIVNENLFNKKRLIIL